MKRYFIWFLVFVSLCFVIGLPLDLMYAWRIGLWSSQLSTPIYVGVCIALIVYLCCVLIGFYAVTRPIKLNTSDKEKNI